MVTGSSRDFQFYYFPLLLHPIRVLFDK